MNIDHFSALETEMRQFIQQLQKRLEGLKIAVDDMRNEMAASCSEQRQLPRPCTAPDVQAISAEQNNAPNTYEQKMQVRLDASKTEPSEVLHEQPLSGEQKNSRAESADERLAAIRRRLAEQAVRRA